VRQGHGRRLLTSLSSKLAILGPPRIVAEVPERLEPACALFEACGFVQEALLTDYVLDGPALSERGSTARVEGLIIPLSIDDLVANGLFGDAQQQTCWERSLDTLTARKDEIEGLAVASDDRIEACILHVPAGEYVPAGEILVLRSFVDDGGERVNHLLSQLLAQRIDNFRLTKVHSSEISKELLETLGFRPAGRHRRYTTTARSG
jgi:hypothetical protein